MTTGSPGDPLTNTVWSPTLEKRRGVSKYKLLTERIIADVETGVLVPGARMPTHRELAHRLGISVQTVSFSYKDAEKQGFLRGEVGRGTFVQAPVTESADRFMLDREPNEVVDLSIIRAVYTEEHEAASRALLVALAASDNSAFMYPCRPIAGLDDHRDAARPWLSGLGVEAGRERIIITNGAAHAIFLAVAAVVRAGDVVVTEQLTDHSIIGLANVLGFTLKGLATDAEGLLPEAFETACSAGGVKALFTIPTFTNPTTHLMGAARRHEIAGIARKYGVFIIEDEVYKPLLDHALPAFAQLAPDLGFFATSFTKSVLTGLRVGYLVVPPHYSIRVSSILRVTGWSATNVVAEMASRWVRDGTASALVEVQRREVRARQALVTEILGPAVASAHPLALCALLAVPQPWSEHALVRVLANQRIAVTSSEPFIANGDRSARRIRICIGGSHSHRTLRDAFHRIVAIFEQLPPVFDAGGIG